MLKRSLSVFLSVLMLVSLLTPAMGVYADTETVDISDYVPNLEDDIVTGNAPQSGANWSGVGGLTVSRPSSDSPLYTITSKTKGTYSDITRPTYGLYETASVSSMVKDTPYVVKLAVKQKSQSTDGKNPNLVYGFVSDTQKDAEKKITWQSQWVYTAEITSTDYQEIGRLVTLAGNAHSNVKFLVGLGVGNTHLNYADEAFEFRTGASVEVDWSQTYIAPERAYDITNVLSTTELFPGAIVTANAEVVNQLGITGNLDQNFTYYITDTEGNISKDFEITNVSGNEVSIKAKNTVLPGRYVVLAVSDEYEGVQRTCPITVTYGDIAKEDGTRIKVTASGDTTVGITDKPTLTATVEKDGDAVEHSAPFTWTAINSDKMTVCEDITITTPSDDDTSSASLSLNLSIAEGEYYIMATSDTMCTLFKVTVDKSGDIENIASKITGKKTDELTENMETYLAVLELSDTICASADAQALASVVLETVEEDEEDSLDIDILKEYFTKSAIVSLYNKNESAVKLYDEKGMFTFADELNLSDMGEGVTLWELFIGKKEKSASEDEAPLMITDEGRLAMQAHIKDSAPYTTINEFKSKAKESILLYTLAYPNVNGFGYVSDVLTEANLKAADIDGADYLALTDKSAVNESVAGTLYTASGLKEALKPSEDGGEGDEGSSSSSEDKYKPTGTGGLGSFGGGSKKDESKEESKEDEKTEKPAVSVNEFSDIPENHWACTDIYFLKEIGVIDGTTETTFTPDATVTREQFLKMLVLAFKLSGTENGKTFTDVKDGAWYAPYVDTGVASGVINGMSDGSFGIGKSITRQDACVMLARALGLDTSVEASLTFGDAGDISGYAANSVGTLTEYAIISGFSDNTFKPNATCTRAQAAKLVANAITIFSSIQQGGSK